MPGSGRNKFVIEFEDIGFVCTANNLQQEMTWAWGGNKNQLKRTSIEDSPIAVTLQL
jgi:hypothetical protein